MSAVELQEIVTNIQHTLGCTHERENAALGLHQPYFAGQEWKYVKECLDSGWVSSVGQFVDRFEQALAEYAGAKHAIAVVNGTAALHTCLLLSGVEPDDEVLLPSLTFVATANAVRYCHATPHFVDVDNKSLGVNPVKLASYLKQNTHIHNNHCINTQTGQRIAALIVMHTFGHPVDLDPIKLVCADHHLVLIEDAAESLGSRYKGTHTGTIGRLGALSFNGNKIITSGGGGAILTNDTELAKQAKHITTTAKMAHPCEYVHDQVGYNYRLPNINAALGLAQLEQLDTFLEYKRALAIRYQESFADNPNLTIFKEPGYANSNYWLNVLLLNNPAIEQRDMLLSVMHESGLMTRPTWNLLHQLTMYQECPRMDLSTSELLAKQIICLPSSVELGIA